MKVKLKSIQDHPVFSEGVLKKAKDSPLLNVFQSMVGAINNQNISYEYHHDEDSYPMVFFNKEKQEMPIEVFFVEDGLQEAFDVDDSCLGLFVIDASVLSDKEALYADAFRVVVSCNEEELIKFIKEERVVNADLPDLESDHYSLESYLRTLAHEVMHAVEFRNHGNSLTPKDVNDAFDHYGFDYSLFDVMSGKNIVESMVAPQKNNDVVIEAMEERVEEKSKELFNQLFDDPDFRKSFYDYFYSLHNKILLERMQEVKESAEQKPEIKKKSKLSL